VFAVLTFLVQGCFLCRVSCAFPPCFLKEKGFFWKRFTYRPPHGFTLSGINLRHIFVRHGNPGISRMWETRSQGLGVSPNSETGGCVPNSETGEGAGISAQQWNGKQAKYRLNPPQKALLHKRLSFSTNSETGITTLRYKPLFSHPERYTLGINLFSHPEKYTLGIPCSHTPRGTPPGYTPLFSHPERYTPLVYTTVTHPRYTPGYIPCYTP